MRQILNTLFVMTQRAYVHLDHETVRVEVDGETRLQIPLHHLGGIVCFGDVQVSTALLHRCAKDGCSVVFMSATGRFACRVVGPTSGNVLLRCAQHLCLSDRSKPFLIARNIVAGKIQNARQIVLRGGREAGNQTDESQLEDAAASLAGLLRQVERSETLDQVRGLEGNAARAYFAALNRIVRPEERDSFNMPGRSRRPPTDRFNALLSFLYALTLSDCVGAAEGIGLDPQIGFLHALRPGRPALALDLLEELRPVMADRLALTLVNRRQITEKHFETRPGGAVYLSEDGRKEVAAAFQRRKHDEVSHAVLDQSVPLGLVAHTQARLLARHLRGDLAEYLPFLYR